MDPLELQILVAEAMVAKLPAAEQAKVKMARETLQKMIALDKPVMEMAIMLTSGDICLGLKKERGF